MSDFPQRFIGEVGFEYEPVEVERLIIRSANDMVVEFLSGGWRYTVNMRSDDGISFSGEYVARNRGEVERAHASGKLYSAGKEKIFFGRWVEGGNAYWLIKMKEVDSFDE